MRIKNKKAALFLAFLILTISLCACDPADGDPVFASGRFTVVQKIGGISDNYAEYYVCDTETNVLYLFVIGGHRAAMTPLFNPDGSLMTINAENDGE